MDSYRICRTYFKFDGAIINGWQICLERGTVVLYTYTACKSLGNWQEFMRHSDIDQVIKYLEGCLSHYDDMESSQISARASRWIKCEKDWQKRTLEEVVKYSIRTKK